MNERPSHRRSPWARRWSLITVAAMVALVAGACAGSLWYADAEGRRLIAAQAQEAADSELDLFVQIRLDQGLVPLARAVELRGLLEGEARHRVYALRDNVGRVLAGNLGAWPEGLGDDEAWRAARSLDGGPPFHVATRALDNGYALLVGQDDAALETFRASILNAIWVSVAIVAITCLTIAIALTTFMLTRVRRLSAAAERFADGDFSARAEGAGEGSPFGEIAAAQNAMLNRIEDLVTGLTTVTDSLAHDLRTPLARTRRRLEEGAASPDASAKQAAIEAALSETDKTIATFTALIDIARAEGGLSRKAMEQIDVSKLVTDVYELFEPLAQERNVAFTYAPPSPHFILGHRPLLMQAVSNLVDNAIRYAPPGGRVVAEIVTDANGVEIVVADNGPGIDPDERANAVRRFRQTSSAAPEGLGLGLAIVDACARLHRGRLVLEDNEPGLRARLSLASG